jgi:hypothetical protein
MTKTIGVVTALALALSSAPAALACFGYCGGGYGGGNSNSSSFTTTTNVAVSNSANVSNSVSVSASTGGNDANGGNASGQNANGGTGGTIDTGNAAAASIVENVVNTVDMEVVAPENCGCEEEEEGSSYGRHGKKGGNSKSVETELNVALDNDASVSNSVEVKAKTGYNDANGGSAEASQENNAYKGYGGYGDYGHSKWGGKKRGGSSSATATAGHGGVITTGDAESASGIVNLINSVVLRVL